MFLQQLSKYDIILGSQSPRRQYLLSELNIPFRVEVKNTDESYPPEIDNSKVPEYLSRKKAAAFTLTENQLLITADTIVLLENEVLNKASNKQEAFEMLSKLSGKMHVVITGVCIKTQTKESCFADHTNVFFKKLDSDEINYYIDNYKPFDKAGAYGVQDWIGYVGVSRMEGSYFNVMGLPLHRLYDELKLF